MTEGSRKNIAIITNDDPVWLLPTWARTIPLLRLRHDVVGIWLVPDTLGNRRGIRIPLWYLSTFGFRVALLLAAFAFKTRLAQLFTPHGGRWQRLGVPVHEAESPNSPEVVEGMRAAGTDVALVTVSHVLRPTFLAAPRIGTINKHAAMLPEGRGVFPYIWAIAHGHELGVSFHEVVEKIDAGRLLVQKSHAEINPWAGERRSMLRFYVDVYRAFPEMAVEAVERLLRGEFLKPRSDAPGRYFSFPTRSDVQLFVDHGGKIVSLGDFFYRGPESP